MTVYAVNGLRLSQQSANNPPTLTLEQAAKLERRIELGRHVPDEAHDWLNKPSQLPRLAFWLELLHRADIDGVCDLAVLATWRFFDTQRKRDYLLRMLEEHELIERLSTERVRVTA